MCGRFALETPVDRVAQLFQLDTWVGYLPRANIPPGTDIPVIRQAGRDGRTLDLLRWGLVPPWAQYPGGKLQPINARGETIAEKPMFKNAFRHRRCLIPADGFYEWKSEGKAKRPYFINLPGGLMAIAGIWETKELHEGPLTTTCIVTTSANELMAPIHDRMPVLVPPEHWEAWLVGSEQDALELIQPYPAEAMAATPV